MKVDVHVPEMDAFQAALKRYVAEVGGGTRSVIRKQGRLLLREAMHFTPPRTRSQGRKAVKADILRSVRPLKVSEFEDRQMRKLVRTRDYPRLQAALDGLQSGPLAGKQVVPFSPTIHQGARNRRGRVPVRHDPALTLDAEELTSYIRSAQDRVGRAKRGWAAGVVALGGSVPPWILNGPSTGRFVDRTDNPLLGFIRADNESEWTLRGDEDRVLRRAFSGRSKAILGDIERRIARAGKEAFR